ncbi:flavin-containing amine oxidase [Penicillium longicatenatum]|uniref:flavin-containing amine oxidase n=1 Tax=Penicillium longicatenatum TaxID=1561947 RepID=UPI00254863E8|nr:flavin-containing amine oxidase [Penicillium longicatenatum]KAJ5649946.1 flavin-containing amine oxidase [Penicillium longicatenatum]
MPQSKEGFLWSPHKTVDGLETDAVTQSSPNIKSVYDAIVIGTGFAGLIAARNLSQDPHTSVLLVEARDRIGGRTWTAKAFGEEFEMGGTWVHWSQPHLYHELHRYGLHHYLKTSAGSSAAEKQYFNSGVEGIREINPEEGAAILERVAAEFFNIDGLSSRELMPFPHEPFRKPGLWSNYDYLTVKQRLDQLTEFSSFEKDLFESNVSTFGSAPGAETGFTEALRWYALGGHSMAGVYERAGIYKIGHGGMTSFARAVLDEFKGDIVMNTVVEQVDEGRNGVTLHVSGGRKLHGKAIISTIPLNCLKNITFNPPLSPLRREAIASGHINKGAKIHFRLGATESGWFATSHASGGSPFLFAFSDHNGNQPSGPEGTWCIGFGYNGHLTDKRESSHIIKEFQENIKPQATIQAYLTHDWMNDPFAKGTWCCWGPNHFSKYVQELQKPHGKVVFASADWADGWRGFVDGAIESGQKSANDVKALIASASPIIKL